MKSIMEDLAYRDLINQVTDREGLEEKLATGRLTLYCGFDPTADSLHIGNLLPILTLRRFQEAGHLPLALVGGGTGLIGDPSGKANERTLNTEDVVQAWSDKIRGQLSRFLDFGENRENAARIVNNYDWLKPLNVIAFLRDIGKNFTVNYMLAKDSVDSRMESGISFTEFSYMILQAYDFYQLNQSLDCSLQLGGSDQWGNITAGLELIGRMSDNRAYGLTIPLVTKSDGKKFGKTESGTIWLDAEKTTPYQFYQFWINTDDADVIKFLKYFTFLERAEIERLEAEVQSAPEHREAQRVLAQELTKLVHGEDALKSAVNITKALFDGNVAELSPSEIEDAFSDVPSVSLTDEAIALVDMLVAAGAEPSKRQARQDIESGAVSVNGERVGEVDRIVTSADRLGGKYVIIRRGKKKYFLIKFD